MSAKHTPGPWIHGGYEVQAADGSTVCNMSGWRGPTQTIINARLIAAAPELLDALIAAMAFIYSHVADPDITKEMRATYAALQATNPEAAIAKATGDAA